MKKKSQKLTRCIRKANFKAIDDDFSSVDWEKEFTGLNTEQSYSKFHEFYERTCTKNIPKVRELYKKSSEKWVNREVKDAVREKHLSWYILKKGLCSE